MSRLHKIALEPLYEALGYQPGTGHVVFVGTCGQIDVSAFALGLNIALMHAQDTDVHIQSEHYTIMELLHRVMLLWWHDQLDSTAPVAYTQQHMRLAEKQLQRLQLAQNRIAEPAIFGMPLGGVVVYHPLAFFGPDQLRQIYETAHRYQTLSVVVCPPARRASEGFSSLHYADSAVRLFADRARIDKSPHNRLKTLPFVYTPVNGMVNF